VSPTLLLFGTGAFAGRIACDIGATAEAPVTVVIAGRNRDRLDWLVTAGRARAAVFGTPAHFTAAPLDLQEAGAAERVLAAHRPAVVVQAASVQASAVIAGRGDGWSRLVAEGGLSATAVFQALLSARVARAVQAASPGALFVNCCFPDVVNGILAALGLPVACGVGNIGILSGAFAGALEPGAAGRLHLLAHYQTIGAWRRPSQDRAGSPVPRVWLDGVELADVRERFAAVRLTPEPAIEISGAAGVPLLVAMATSGAARTHVPGPFGLPGGYPVRWRDGALGLDLPPGLTREAAIAWNAGFEAANGLVVGADGVARYTGLLRDRLRAISPALAEGFAVRDLEAVHAEMAALRRRLQGG